MKVLILNGPNLNLLGKREPEVYGAESFDDYLKALREKLPHITIEYYQSNVEGELINQLHKADDHGYEVILFNAGAYTHTSVAIGDAVAGITTPVIEVHISNVMKREEFRHVSYISKHAAGVISGFGLLGYELGMHYLSIR